MTYKEKTRSNPFGDVLQPAETLLWSHTPRPLSFGAHFLRYVIMCIIGIAIISFLFAAWIVLAHPDEPRYNPTGQPWFVLWATYTGTNFVVMTPFAGILFLLIYPVFGIQNRRSGNTAYALTSDRLLTWTKGHITETPLEEVQTIKRRSRDSLSFGKAHPAWQGIKDPKSVASLIEQAKAAHEA
jgi:hypothetical protein